MASASAVKLTVRLMQDEGRGDPKGGLRPLYARNQQAMRRRAGARMHWQDRDRPEPVLHRGQDRGEPVRAVDQRELAARPEQSKAGPDPAHERRSAGLVRKHMRAGPARIRRGPHRAEFEEWGVRDDKVGRLVFESGRPPGAGVENVSLSDSNPVRKTVAPRVSRRDFGQ